MLRLVAFGVPKTGVFGLLDLVGLRCCSTGMGRPLANSLPADDDILSGIDLVNALRASQSIAPGAPLDANQEEVTSANCRDERNGGRGSPDGRLRPVSGRSRRLRAGGGRASLHID